MKEYQRILINEYSSIIEAIRTILTNVKIVREQSCEYAIFRTFCKQVLTMCEIYTLLLNGYPNGAYVLSRSTFEALVIIDYLASHGKDGALIERFFVDAEVSALQLKKSLIKYKSEYAPDEDDSYILKEVDVRLKEIADMYTDYCDSGNLRFSDYWWVEKGCNFARLTSHTNFKKNYMYTDTSKKVHVSAYSVLNYVGDIEDDVLIGESYIGIESPMWFSLLNLLMSLDILQKALNINCHDICIRIINLTSKSRRKEP